MFHELQDLRLRPICDAIEEGNNKNAMLLADRALKATPADPSPKILKAIGMVRSGRQRLAEALALVEEAKKSPFLSTTSLQFMLMFYRDVGTPEAVVPVYESIVKARPQDQELAVQYFFACARVLDYKQQQLAASHLTKTFPVLTEADKAKAALEKAKSAGATSSIDDDDDSTDVRYKYPCWAIKSVHVRALEARAAGDAMQADKLLFPLAERMCAKAREDGRLDTEEGARMYHAVLVDQGKWADAIALLQGPLGEQFNLFWERDELLCEALTAAGRHADAYRLLATTLEREPDLWNAWCGLFDSAVARVPAEGSEAAHEETRRLIEAATAKQMELPAPKRKRGPFLARLKFLLSRLGGAVDDAVVAHFVEYVRLFGPRPCCADDVRSLLVGVASAEARAKIAAAVCAVEGGEPGDTPVDTLLRAINVWEIEWLAGRSRAMDRAKRMELARSFTEKYHRGLELGKDLTEKQPQHADGFAHLAAVCYLSIFEDTGDVEPLLHAVSILEVALKRSKYAYLLRIVLLVIYGILGAAEHAYSNFLALELSHVQLDSMSYIANEHLARLGLHTEALAVSSSVLAHFQAAESETPEYVVHAYWNCTYSKVSEVVDFLRRTRNSVEQWNARAEEDYFGLVLNNKTASALATATADKAAQCPPRSALCDNRDFDVLDTFESLGKQCSSGMRAYLFDRKAWHVGVRTALHRAVVALADGRQPDALSALGEVRSALVTLPVPPPSEKILLSVAPHTYYVALATEALPVVLAAADALAAIRSENPAAKEQLAAGCDAAVKMLRAYIDGVARTLNERSAANAGGVHLRGDDMQALAIATEVVGLIGAFAGVVGSGSSKKSKNAAAKNEVRAVFDGFKSKYVELSLVFAKALKDIDAKLVPSGRQKSLEDTFLQLTLSDTDEAKVRALKNNILGIVNDAHIAVVRGLGAVVNRKATFVRGL